MRRIILATVFVASATIAQAQVSPAPQSGMSPMTQPNSATNGSGSGQMPKATPSPGMSPRTVSENCGTPDEPKPCPPMPRRNLATYPANKP